MNRIRYFATWFLLLLLTAACQQKVPQQNGILGAWSIRSFEYPNGQMQYFPVDGEISVRIYDADSTLYICQLQAKGNETILIPVSKKSYEYTDSTYSENNKKKMQVSVSDSLMVLTDQGFKEIWERATSMTETRMQEIRDVMNDADENQVVYRYVLATTERKLRSEVSLLQWLAFLLLLVGAAIVAYALHIRSRKKSIERKLKAIAEEKALRPSRIDDTIRQMEAEFFSSDYYLQIRKRIEAGENLKQNDWDELERRLKGLYLNFSSTLYGMYNLSQLEYQVCLLLKIHTAPSEIANVVNKDKSTISNIRRRLYKKVFGKDGSAKDWDEFIDSL